MTKKEVPECIVEITKTDIYVVYGGVRIAKRGKARYPSSKNMDPFRAGVCCPQYSRFFQNSGCLQ